VCACVCMCVHVCACVCMCVHVCACVRVRPKATQLVTQHKAFMCSLGHNAKTRQHRLDDTNLHITETASLTAN
jgi:hypothetical protein